MRARYLALLPLSGCSLTSLVDLPIAVCDKGTPLACNQQICGDLNQSKNIDVSTACHVYQYASGGGCVLGKRDWDGDDAIAAECSEQTAKGDCDDTNPDVHPGANEKCNGLDDDCDGVVDEGVYVAESASTRIDLATTGSLRYGLDPSGVALASDGELEVAELSREAVSAVVASTNASDVLSSAELTQGCPNPDPTKPAFPHCHFQEVSAARGDGAWLVGAVETTGCAEGRLRVGYLAEEDAAQGALSFVQRGPEARSNVYRGVDLIAPGADKAGCSGQSNAPVRVGATRPSVALASAPQQPDGTTTAGLVAWIGDSADPDARAACGGAAAALNVLGLWLEVDPASNARRWVDAANAGAPSALGTTAQGGAPAVVATSKDAFVVAGADADANAIKLWQVTVPHSPLFSGEDGVVRTTGPITTKALLSVPGSAGAEGISMSLATPSSGKVCGKTGGLLALGFHTGCGTAQAVQYFAVLGVTSNGAACVVTPPVALGTFDGQESRGALSAFRQASGLVREGFSRGGKTADASQTGGWLAAWTNTDAQRRPYVVISRVLDLDGKPLATERGDAEALEVRKNADQPQFFRSGDSGAVELAVRLTDESGLETRGISCSPK